MNPSESSKSNIEVVYEPDRLPDPGDKGDENKELEKSQFTYREINLFLQILLFSKKRRQRISAAFE